MTIDTTVLQLSAIAIALLISITALILVYKIQSNSGKAFGPSAARSFAVAIFVPAVIIVASVSALDPQAIAALLGTIAGYIFSTGKGDS